MQFGETWVYTACRLSVVVFEKDEAAVAGWDLVVEEGGVMKEAAEKSKAMTRD